MDNTDMPSPSSSRRDRNSPATSRPGDKMSLFSPFPFGSPMSRMNSFQTSFSGSPGQKMLLGTSLHNQSRTVSDEVRQVMTPRLKGQDIYGGPVMFGNSARKSRLLSSSPYTAALQSRTREKQSKLDRSNFLPSLGMIPPPRPPSSLPSTAPSSPHSSPGPSSSSSPPAQLSTSAQIILSTLEKINKSGTPVTDARKIPLISPSRAEKRKFLESELNSSINSGSPSRRRRRLGGGGLALSGPPLRKNFSPSVNLSNSSSTSSPLSDSTTLSVTRSQVSTPLSSKTVSLETRTRDESSSGLSRQSSKSGLKMKSKVVETGRSSSVSAAPEAPSFSLPATAQLQVEQMPVFNFVSAPDTRNAASVSSEKQSAVTPAVAPPSVSPVKSDVKSDDPETNNNDKSPVKRSYQDSCESAACSVKKVKSSEDAGSVSLELDNNITSYKFSEPRPVIDSSGVKPLVSTSVRYSFSAPSPVRSSPETIVGSVTALPSTINPAINFKTMVQESSSTTLNGVKSMPDVTNNTMFKANAKAPNLRGSGQQQPDITASTGFGGFLPAKELKAGSVMDFLGLRNSGV